MIKLVGHEMACTVNGSLNGEQIWLNNSQATPSRTGSVEKWIYLLFVVSGPT